MLKTLVQSYIDIYEVANNTSLSIDERNKLLDALLPITELIARVDKDTVYMMSTFNTYAKTVEWLKQLVTVL